MVNEAISPDGSYEAKQVLLDYLEENGIYRDNGGGHPAHQGEVWIFHTVTRYILGRIKYMTPKYAVLEYASWIPDEGRSMQAIMTGSFNEVEPMGTVQTVVHLESCTDSEGPLPFDAPTEQK